MFDRADCERALVDNLEWARGVMAAQCRNFRMGRAEADEFQSWAIERLVDNEYHIFRQFRGGSSIRTYLRAVIRTLIREYAAARWGRYRPSSAARRAGPTGLALDRLINRDGLSATQAASALMNRGAAPSSERDLTRLALSLPVRNSREPIPLEQLIDIPTAPNRADDRISSAEEVAELESIRLVIESSLQECSEFDVRVLEMHFWQRLAISEIARQLGIPQKPLYRTFDRLLGFLRQRLESRGLTRADVLDLVSSRAA